VLRPYHTNGKHVTEICPESNPNLQAALHMAGLGWTCEESPLQKGDRQMSEQNQNLTPTPREGHGYRPTDEELRLLTRHWVEVERQFILHYFLYNQVSSSARHLRDHASTRLALLAEHLGADVVGEIEDEVKDRERHNLGPDLARSFASGCPDEWHRVQQEIWQIDKYLTAKQEDEATREKAFAFLKVHPDKIFFDDAGDLWSLIVYPWSKEGLAPDGLVLQVMTAQGNSATLPAYQVERPVGWVEPYGLGAQLRRC
jgi:hypothetical protein